jgi:hypothetical protein
MMCKKNLEKRTDLAVFMENYKVQIASILDGKAIPEQDNHQSTPWVPPSYL